MKRTLYNLKRRTMFKQYKWNVSILVLLLWVGCIFCLCSPNSVYAQTPAGKMKKRITTGTPTHNGVNPFSVQIKFETDGGTKFKIKATANINGPDQPAPDNPTTKAKKIADAITAAIKGLPAASQGVRADQAVILNPAPPAPPGGGPRPPAPPPTPLPEVIIQNQAGFKLSKKSVKIIDKTGEKEKIVNLLALLTGNETVTGINLVGNSTGGLVAIQVDRDDRALVSITTAEKSTSQIEQELVTGLKELGIAATLSNVALDPEPMEGEPPFDGGEIQIRAPERYPITIDINDSGLYLIVTSEFGDSEPPEERVVDRQSEFGDSEPPEERVVDRQTAIIIALLLAIVALIIGFLFGRRRT